MRKFCICRSKSSALDKQMGQFTPVVFITLILLQCQSPLRVCSVQRVVVDERLMATGRQTEAFLIKCICRSDVLLPPITGPSPLIPAGAVDVTQFAQFTTALKLR